MKNQCIFEHYGNYLSANYVHVGQSIHDGKMMHRPETLFY